MGTHDLAGEGEADAGAFGAGGEERVEDDQFLYLAFCGE